MSTFNPTHIYMYSEAVLFLSTTGTRVALQTKADCCYVFAQKKDFLVEVKARLARGIPGFTDYDGDKQYVWIEDNILYVPYGIF